MADDKKKVTIQAVPDKLPDKFQGMKAAPPADPIKVVEPIQNPDLREIVKAPPPDPIKQVEPIQRPKQREYKQTPPPDPPPEQQGSSDSKD